MSVNSELREQVIHYFRAVGSGQNMVQCIKQVLFLHEHFNPVLIFEKLSRGKQRITTKNWRDFLTHINLNFTEREFKYFMKQNGYKSEITLNEFLQSIIPYNGDVVREYKQKCTGSIRINESSKEVDYIFAELIENQFKLIRILINIRDEISVVAGLRDIEELVKTDLLNDLEKNGLPREHRKLQETFEQKGFKLGFSELRKFFKVWVPQKVIIHELCMLNVMRHLKSNDPFCKIIFKKKRKGLINDNSAAKRSRTRLVNDQTPYGSEEKKGPKAEESPYSKHLNHLGPDDKYNNFKDKLLNEFHETKKQELYKNGGNHSNKKESLQNPYQKEVRQTITKGYLGEKQFSRRPESSKDVQGSASKYQQSYGGGQSFRGQERTYNEAEAILRFFEQMVNKEQSLERLRKDLAKNNDFSLINLYKLMDTKNKGYVTSRDISDFPDIEKAQYLYMVNFYGHENDKLLFHEFCEIFRPLSRQLNEAIDSRPENKIPVLFLFTLKDPFKRQTRRLIIEILKLTAEEHFNLQKMREGMRRINPKQMFLLMDVHGKGFLDSDTLLTVFKQNNIYCDDKSLKCLMKLFRKRIDEKISFVEFAKFVQVR